MEVRLARVEDVEEIVRLERGLATAPHWGEGVYREMVAGGGVKRGLFVAVREDREPEKRDMVEGAGGAVRREKLVGFGVAKVLGEVGEVESLAVRETEQRRGVGRALLGAVLQWCCGEGARVVELEVRAGGLAARKVYEGAGFTVVGIRPGYYDDPGEDAVLMRRLRGSDEEEGHV